MQQKHDLSDKSLESVLRKLASAGLLTEAEMLELSRPPSTLALGPQEDDQHPDLQQCPACGKPLMASSPECPACGVVLAKYAARGEQERPAPPLEPELSGGRSGRLLIGIFLALVLVAGGYFAFQLKDTAQDRPRSGEESLTTEVSEQARTESGATDEVPAEEEGGDKETPKAQSIFAMDTGELFELRFVSEGLPLGLSVTEGSGGVHFFETPDPNQGFKKFPPETGAERYYDQLTLAGRTFLMVTERSNPPMIYLDTNRNGDMTDDPGPFAGEGPNAAPNHYTLELPYDGEDVAVPYRLWLFPSNMGGIRFHPQCHWEGLIELNGSTYRMVTFDSNADGDYSNDPLIIDVDNDGKAADSERLKAGQSVTIDGTEVILLAVAPSGRWVRLQY